MTTLTPWTAADADMLASNPDILVALEDTLAIFDGGLECAAHGEDVQAWLDGARATIALAKQRNQP